MVSLPENMPLMFPRTVSKGGYIIRIQGILTTYEATSEAMKPATKSSVLNESAKSVCEKAPLNNVILRPPSLFIGSPAFYFLIAYKLVIDDFVKTLRQAFKGKVCVKILIGS